MLSCVNGFLPIDIANIYIFFTINALLEYYFFNYKEIAFLTGGKKKKDDFSSPQQCSYTKLFFQSHNS